MKRASFQRSRHFAAEHLTWLSICGLVAIITGFTPEEWVSHIAEKLRVSGLVIRDWPTYLDIRAALVAVGVGVIVTDVFLKRRAASRHLSTATAAAADSPSSPVSAPAPDIIGALTKNHAPELIERVCQKIDAFAGMTPKTRAREHLLGWLHGELEETETAISELGKTINANQAQGDLGNAIANLGHATNLGDQNRLKRALELAIRELEQTDDARISPKMAEMLKQLVRMSLD